MFRRCHQLFAVVLLSSALFSPQALAHKVNLFAYAEGMKVFVEGYFVDGKAAQNSKVQVFNSDDELLLEDVTDDEGRIEFDLNKVSDIKVVLNAGMGHQTSFDLSADELGLGGSMAVSEVSSSDDVSSDSAQTDSEPTPSVRQVSNTQQGDIEALVYKAVSEANKPLVRELTASQQKASLSGIVGGVGYIIGFLGLFAFFKARQMTKEANPEG